MNPEQDAITIAPTITGQYGRAWLMDADAICRYQGVKREDGGDLASWVVEAPWAHPFWHSYWMCIQHLRPIAGVRGADSIKVYLPGATHELVLYAVDPDHAREPMILTGAIRRLIPANFAAQIIETSDAMAVTRIRRAVEMICAGILSPDTDFRQQWVGLFGDNMINGERT